MKFRANNTQRSVQTTIVDDSGKRILTIVLDEGLGTGGAWTEDRIRFKIISVFEMRGETPPAPEDLGEMVQVVQAVYVLHFPQPG